MSADRDEPADTTQVRPPARPDVDQSSAPYLIVLSGRDDGELLTLVDRSSYVIGSGDDANFRVVDYGVSRRHALITVEGDRVVVEDLRSTNGTRVNGAPVTFAHPLADGDKISIGATTILKFTYHGTLPEALYRRSLRDPLTMAYREKYFVEHLRADFAYSRRHRTPLSTVVFDVDHFHSLRETHGADITDNLLVQVVRRVARVIGTRHCLTRLSTRRFALLCRGLGSAEALTVAEDLGIAVAGVPVDVGTLSIPATISTGIASLPWSIIDSTDTFMRMAEIALEDAKSAGRNRAVIANPIADVPSR